MAILRSAMMDGAQGSIGNLTLRQVNGQTVASNKRVGIPYNKLSPDQQKQCSTFGLAVELLQWAPFYAQKAFLPLGRKSSYNRAVGHIVDILNSGQNLNKPVTFQDLVELLHSYNGFINKGIEYPCTCGGISRNIISISGFPDDSDTDLQARFGYYLWIVDEDYSADRCCFNMKEAGGNNIVNADGIMEIPTNVQAAGSYIVIPTFDNKPITVDKTFSWVV